MLLAEMSERLSLRILRERVPTWQWKAERRYGLGWNYTGSKDGRSVCIYCTAVLCGEDEFQTQWRVDDGVKSETFASWWLHEGLVPPLTIGCP